MDTQHKPHEPEPIGTCGYSNEDIFEGDETFDTADGEVLERYREYYAMDYFSEELYQIDEMENTHDAGYANEANGTLYYCETDGEYYISENNLIYIDGSYYRANDCNIVYSSRHGEYMLTSEYNDTIRLCATCNDEIDLNNDSYTYDDCDDIICQDCNENRGSANILSYSYKPEPKFFRTDNNPKTLFYGLEIEVEGDRDTAAEVLDLSELFYCKEDSSLDNGFEIVTHPFSWNWFEENKNLFKDLSKLLIRRGMRAYNCGRAGIHVHVSRNQISDLTIAKLLIFFYSEPDLIQLISQRTKSSFNSWSNILYQKNRIYDIANKKYSIDRNSAINLYNLNTVEFRSFRSNLRYDRILKNIQFVKSIIEFCKIAGIKDLNKQPYFNYLDRKNYFYILSFLKEKNLINKKQPILIEEEA
jgi:hypothetical protein